MEKNNRIPEAPTSIDGLTNLKDSTIRDQVAMAIIGDKRQGKSALVKVLIRKYINMYPHKRILVYDPSNAFGAKGESFAGYKTISLTQLREGYVSGGKRVRWSGGVRRLVPGDKDNHRDFLAWAATDFTDGLLVIDEATAVFPDTATDSARKVLITHTNMRVDIICIFHGLAFVPKRLRAQFWAYVFFKCPDQIDVRGIESLGFPEPAHFYKAFEEAQNAPVHSSSIIQYFTKFQRHTNQ